MTLNDERGKTALYPLTCSIWTLSISLDSLRLQGKDKKATKCGHKIHRWLRQNLNPSILSFLMKSVMTYCCGEGGKRREHIKERGRRQVEACDAIYPMQREIIAYHSMVWVSSIKALRGALRGAQTDKSPWEAITKCTIPPPFCWSYSLRLKINFV